MSEAGLTTLDGVTQCVIAGPLMSHFREERLQLLNQSLNCCLWPSNQQSQEMNAHMV